MPCKWILGFCVACSLLAAQDLAEDARQAQASGDYERAARDYSELLKSEPSPELRSNLGVMLYMADREREALTQFQTALKEKPTLVASRLFAGLSLLRLGHPQEALPYLQAAEAADPSEVLPNLSLARACLAAHDLQSAKRYYGRVTELKPSNAEAWYGLGIVTRSLAEQHLKQASEAGLSGAALANSAHANSARTDLAEAQSALERAIALDPDNAKAHLLMGESFRVAGQKEKSILEYQAILRQHPTSFPAMLGLANTYWKFADVDDAMKMLKEALAVKPEDAEANGILADLLVGKKQFTEAKVLALKALAKRPDLSFIRVAIAKIEIHEGNDGAAITELQQALPDDVDGSWHYLLARELQKEGRTSEAEIAFARSRELRNTESH